MSFNKSVKLIAIILAGFFVALAQGKAPYEEPSKNPFVNRFQVKNKISEKYLVALKTYSTSWIKVFAILGMEGVSDEQTFNQTVDRSINPLISDLEQYKHEEMNLYESAITVRNIFLYCSSKANHTNGVYQVEYESILRKCEDNENKSQSYTLSNMLIYYNKYVNEASTY